MKNYLELGPVPADENCQQVGTPGYDHDKDTADLRRYKAMLEKRWPEAHFGIKSFPHDFGTYREVVVYYDDEDENPIAFEIEANLPWTWDEHTPSVTH
jgi:hypothetical protein